MIELCTLGTAVVRDAGHHRTLQPKDVALLAYLVAARPRGPQRREILVSLLWPETGERRARNALNQALHRIRKALGPGVVLSRGYVGACWAAAGVANISRASRIVRPAMIGLAMAGLRAVVRGQCQ